MIELRNVCKTYKSKSSDDTIALNEISCKFASTGLIFITGVSGSGKSTLLNCLGGLDSVDSGAILVGDKNISSMDEKELDSYRNSHIGFIFQDNNILESLDVYDNIALALELQGNSDDGKVLDLLRRVGLEGLEKRKINELSGGQQGRVAIARALIKNPALILADEPTGNLDSESSRQIMSLLKSISTERTVIVVSHDLHLAHEYGSRIIEIADGKIVSDSNPIVAELQNNSIELKKSSLSQKNALKISFGNIGIKKVRFVLTVILLTFALLFVAFSLNVSLFDRSSLSLNTLSINDEYYLDFYRSNCKNTGGYISCDKEILEEEDIKELGIIAGVKMNPAYSLLEKGSSLNFTFGPHEDEENNYYNSNRPIYVEIADDNIVEDIVGNIPTKSGEIVISKRVAEMIVKHGVISKDGTLYKPNSLNELLTANEELKLGENIVVVVGYIDEDDSMYTSIKETGYINDYELSQHFKNYSYDYDYIYVKDFVETVKLDNNAEDILSSIYLTYTENSKYLGGKISIIDKNIEYFTENGIANTSILSQNQTVLSLKSFKFLYPNFDTEFTEYQKNNNTLTYDEAIKTFLTNILKNTRLLNTQVQIVNIQSDKDNLPLKIIGITLDSNIYLSESVADYYSGYNKKMIGARIYNTDSVKLKSIFEEFNLTESTDEVGEFYTVDFKYANDVIWTSKLYEIVHKYLLVITGIFVIFAALLIYNFIITTINHSKKDIGILRALGTSNKDVIKIFGFEVILIGLISWILSITLWICSSKILNTSLNEGIHNMEYIVTEPLIVLYIFLFALVLSILLTIVSISRISKIKPVDAILNK